MVAIHALKCIHFSIHALHFSHLVGEEPLEVGIALHLVPKLVLLNLLENLEKARTQSSL